MAIETGEDKELVRAAKTLIQSCCQVPIEPDNLTVFDLEYIFVQLRANSVSNISKVAYIDKEDNKRYDFEIDLLSLKVEMPEDPKNKIKVTDDVSILMKYPTIASTEAVANIDGEYEMLDALIVKCIDKIWDKETVYDEFTEEELTEWLDHLPTEVYDQIRLFFDTIPTLKHTLTYTNEKGTERSIELEGITDFFTWPVAT